MVSITEANQNFSKVARLADEHGTAVIKKTIYQDTLSYIFARQIMMRLHQMKMC